MTRRDALLEWIGRVILIPLVAVGAASLIGMLFLWATGYPALATFRAIIEQSFEDWYGIGQVLRTTTLLIFTGLAVAFAFHAGLFNIGVEGQLYIGAIAVGIAGYYLRQMPRESVEQVPWALWIIGLILVAMIAAALWAAVPGVLKAATGAHEVITTIMMNFVAFALVNYLVRPDPKSFAVPATLHTPSVPQHVRMPRLSKTFEVFEGSTVNGTLFLALFAAVAAYAVLRFTRLGYEVRAVGKNPLASRLAGISPGRVCVVAMVISGAFAGLVGIDFVLGYKGYFEENFSAGLGFIGIAVALLANNHPIGVIFTAFLFAVLNYGKVAAAGEIPKDIIDIMEAGIIFAVIIGNRVFGNLLVRTRKRMAIRQSALAPSA
jgi:general nucleoside transport system permease protein